MAEPEVAQPEPTTAEWRIQTKYAARCGDVEYFQTAFAAADNTPNGWETHIKLIAIAMENEKTATWAKKLPLAEIMLADNEKGLRKYYDNVHRGYGGCLPQFHKIVEIIGAERHMVEMLVERNDQHISIVYNHVGGYYSGRRIITREFCLGDNGSLLHKVWSGMQKKSLKMKLKKLNAEPGAEPNPEAEAETRRALIARIKMDLSDIKWLIKQCGLTKSDLASVGLPWPWQWPPPKLS